MKLGALHTELEIYLARNYCYYTVNMGHSDSFDLNTSMFAARQSAMNALMEKLRASGISSNLQISLPRIAVIGSQSAGKSSLIEGISGVRPFAALERYAYVITTDQPPASRWHLHSSTDGSDDVA